MQTFKDYQPTAFDVKGLGSEDKESWLVLPVIQTRDSEPLERANFNAALKMLNGESDYVEVHRFNHWGPGWFEIIVINPEHAETLNTAEDIERSLEDYPVLDEELLSEYEQDDLRNTLTNCYDIAVDDLDKVTRLLFNKHNISTAAELSCTKVEEVKAELLLTPESRLENALEELGFEEVLNSVIHSMRKCRERIAAEHNHPAAGRIYGELADKIESVLNAEPFCNLYI